LDQTLDKSDSFSAQGHFASSGQHDTQVNRWIRA